MTIKKDFSYYSMDGNERQAEFQIFLECSHRQERNAREITLFSLFQLLHFIYIFSFSLRNLPKYDIITAIENSGKSLAAYERGKPRRTKLNTTETTDLIRVT